MNRPAPRTVQDRRNETGAASRLGRSPYYGSRGLILIGLILPWILYFAFANFGRYALVNPFLTGDYGDSSSVDVFFSRFKQASGALVVVYGLATFRSWGRGVKASAGMLGFAGFALLSNLWSVHLEQSLRYSMLLLDLIVATAVLLSVLSRRRVVEALFGVVAAVCVASAAAALFVPEIGVHSATDALQGVHAGRWRGIMGHKNLLGLYGVLGVILSFIPNVASWPRPVLWLVRLSAIACVAFSGDASAIVGIVAGGSIIYLLSNRTNLRPAILGSIFLLAVPAVVLLLAVAPLAASWLGRDPSFSGRTEIWAKGLEIWQTHNPLFGNGYSVADIYVIGPLLKNAVSESASDAHNGYISMLTDVGLAGFAIFAASVVAALVVGLRRMLVMKQEDYTVSLIAVAILICGLIGAVSEVAPLQLFGTGWLTFVAVAVFTCPGDGAPLEQAPRPSRRRIGRTAGRRQATA